MINAYFVIHITTTNNRYNELASYSQEVDSRKKGVDIKRHLQIRVKTPELARIRNNALTINGRVWNESSKHEGEKFSSKWADTP